MIIRRFLFAICAAVLVGLSFGAVVSPTLADHLQCSDGVDNDGDGQTDFPADTDCTSASDASEGAAASTASSSVSSRPALTLSVTDDRTAIRPGDGTVYVITVRQDSEPVREVDVEFMLPAEAQLVSADRGGVVSGSGIRWQRLQLMRGQAQALTVQAGISNNAPEGLQFVARVRADGVEVSDTTLVTTNPQQQTQGTFALTLSDGVSEVLPNGRLTYTLTVRNNQTAAQTADVTLSLPPYVTPDQITPAAVNAAGMLVWTSLTLAPGETRTHTVTALVSRSAPENSSLTARAQAGSVSVSDTTIVRMSQTSSSHSSSSSRSSSSSSRGAARSVLFTKSADKSEVMPGGIIRFTLSVQNVLLNTIDNAVVTDRFDASMLTVSDLGGGIIATPGEIRWTLPRLLPGETWQQTYSVAVAPHVQNGTLLSNVATISGTDVAGTTLDEKVAVISTGVVGQLPSTGAAMDIIFVGMSLPLAAAAVYIQRRMRRI